MLLYPDSLGNWEKFNSAKGTCIIEVKERESVQYCSNLFQNCSRYVGEIERQTFTNRFDCVYCMPANVRHRCGCFCSNGDGKVEERGVLHWFLSYIHCTISLQTQTTFLCFTPTVESSSHLFSASILRKARNWWWSRWIGFKHWGILINFVLFIYTTIPHSHLFGWMGVGVFWRRRKFYVRVSVVRIVQTKIRVTPKTTNLHIEYRHGRWTQCDEWDIWTGVDNFVVIRLI